MRSFALAIATLLLLTACTDDPQPIEPPASPSQSAEAPPLPDKATTETPEGAIAFVAHWIETLNFATNTGQVNEFKALNDSACKGCESYEDEIVRLNGNGAQVRNFKWIGGKSFLTEDRQLEVSIESRNYQVRNMSSDEWSTVKGAEQELGFTLKWSDQHWQVRQLYIPEDAK